MNTATVRLLAPDDWDRVRAIYEEGIATRNATFETAVPPWSTWDASHLSEHRLVSIVDDVVVAWAALSPGLDRCVYSGVAENSVYVAAEARGQGVGRLLLTSLVAGAEVALWTIQTGIFLENSASVRLHQSCGFPHRRHRRTHRSARRCVARHALP